MPQLHLDTRAHLVLASRKPLGLHARDWSGACKKQDQPFCLFIASNDGHGPYTTGDSSAYDADKLTIPPYWLDTPKLRDGLVKYYAEITNFDSLVGNIITLTQLLPKLNITDDPELENMRQQIETKLTRTNPDDLRNSRTPRKKVANEATAILENMKGYVA